jgi:hypothetical protein
MPNVQIPPGLSESGDVDHDQTQGGTAGNPHGESARVDTGIVVPVFASRADVPDSIEKGEVVYIDGDGLYEEDGT